jgi:hypothetical protein
MKKEEAKKNANKMSELVYDKMSSTIVSVVYFIWGFITGVVSAIVIKAGLI